MSVDQNEKEKGGFTASLRTEILMALPKLTGERREKREERENFVLVANTNGRFCQMA